MSMLSRATLAALLLSLPPGAFAQADDAHPDASDAATQAVEYCPTLPPGSGLQWDYQQGPDFGVCYAIETASKHDAFGIYMGQFPNFDPKRAAAADRIGTGGVGGHAVTWYRKHYSDAPAGTIGQEARLDMRRSGSFHIWVHATSPAELKQRLAILEGIRFQR